MLDDIFGEIEKLKQEKEKIQEALQSYKSTHVTLLTKQFALN